VSQYAAIADLYRYGFREEARGDLVDEVLNAQLISASGVVDGYLVGRYGVGSMPLVSWGEQVTEWVVRIATYQILMGPRGMAEEAGDYAALRAGYDDAHKMLSRVQRQDYTPIGLVPRTAQGATNIQPNVITCVPRGW
jgi:phage gp36-like protein